MLKTTLYFPSFETLCRFKRKLGYREIVLFSKLNVLVAKLEEEEVCLACSQYMATVVQQQRATTILAHHPVGLRQAV